MHRFHADRVAIIEASVCDRDSDPMLELPRRIASRIRTHGSGVTGKCRSGNPIVARDPSCGGTAGERSSGARAPG
jgi:hypothetical protein